MAEGPDVHERAAAVAQVLRRGSAGGARGLPPPLWGEDRSPQGGHIARAQGPITLRTSYGNPTGAA